MNRILVLAALAATTLLPAAQLPGGDTRLVRRPYATSYSFRRPIGRVLQRGEPDLPRRHPAVLSALHLMLTWNKAVHWFKSTGTTKGPKLKKYYRAIDSRCVDTICVAGNVSDDAVHYQTEDTLVACTPIERPDAIRAPRRGRRGSGRATLILGIVAAGSILAWLAWSELGDEGKPARPSRRTRAGKPRPPATGPRPPSSTRASEERDAAAAPSMPENAPRAVEKDWTACLEIVEAEALRRCLAEHLGAKPDARAIARVLCRKSPGHEANRAAIAEALLRVPPGRRSGGSDRRRRSAPASSAGATSRTPSKRSRRATRVVSRRSVSP
jgi:hypothetical protein